MKTGTKKPNKQHDVRGASLVRLARRIRAGEKRAMDRSNSPVLGSGQIIEIIAHAIELEGKATRRLR